MEGIALHDPERSDADQQVSIRPGISILSVLRHLNYRPWYALAEFVDNSLQSFLDYREELQAVGTDVLTVAIERDEDGGRLIVRDNAAGIHQKDYARAFRPAEIPPDRSGLAEFGMGLKSASCWFAPTWTVRTTALAEPIERTVAFDIAKILREELEHLDVATRPAPAEMHYTEIILSEVFRPARGRTVGKIKEHLASIYRVFLRRGILRLTFDGESLSFHDRAVLVAPYFRDPSSEPRVWRKDIDFDFGEGQRVHGFAALRERGSTSEAGFALFRRDRLIQGSGDEAYRPWYIFGASNSFTYQRLFGELQLEGFEVSHTKDGFQWEEHEELVLELLKEELDREPLPLLSQAEGHRTRIRQEEARAGAQIAVDRTAEVIERDVAPILETQLDEPDTAPIPEGLPAAELASRRMIEIECDGVPWQIELELSTDPGVSDWLYVSDRPSPSVGGTRSLGIRVAMAHPFMERFAGAWDAAQIEPLLRVAAALALAEVTAREAGVALAGSIRLRVNQLLREAMCNP
jgi:Histidine kinase-, DNA gyrase B-, and HSP90-like ATPase